MSGSGAGQPPESRQASVARMLRRAVVVPQDRAPVQPRRALPSPWDVEDPVEAAGTDPQRP